MLVNGGSKWSKTLESDYTTLDDCVGIDLHDDDTI